MQDPPLPTFAPTSNAQLDGLLDTIREELFIPARLPRGHARLMYSVKGHKVLAEEPVVVTVGGQEIALKPKLREVPVPVKMFTRCLEAMKTPEDLDVLPALVRGFAQAKRPLREGQLEKMARLINMNGRIDLLVHFTRSASKETGFVFRRPLAREFMRGLKMQSALPHKADALKGLRFGEQLLNLLGEPHAKHDPNARLKRDPVVVGTLLAMFAATSVRFNRGADHKGSALDYTHRLKNCWKDVEWHPNLNPRDATSAWRAKNAVLDYIPVLEGLVTARSVLASESVIPFLESESAKLNEHLTTWKDFLDKHTPAGTKCYGAHSYREVVNTMASRLAAQGPEPGEDSDAPEAPGEAGQSGSV